MGVAVVLMGAVAVLQAEHEGLANFSVFCNHVLTPSAIAASGRPTPTQPRTSSPRRTRVTATAYWHPAGVWGLVYWYLLIPAHVFIFRGLTRAILRRAAR